MQNSKTNVLPEPCFKVAELEEYLDEQFPQVKAQDDYYFLESITKGSVSMRFEANESVHLRPGGTISGPAMFALADYAAYAVVLAHVGKKPLSVTTSLTINFVRKPEPPTLLAKANILKLGKRLVVIEIKIKTPKSQDLVAHATATYSISP